MSAMPFSDLRPTVVMADSSPLIHLAAVGQLDLLFEYGRTAVGQTPIKAERLRTTAVVAAGRDFFGDASLCESGSASLLCRCRLRLDVSHSCSIRV